MQVTGIYGDYDRHRLSPGFTLFNFPAICLTINKPR